jgi:hypothetical protein
MNEDDNLRDVADAVGINSIHFQLPAQLTGALRKINIDI